MEKDRNPDELIKTPEKDAISVNQLETVAGGRSGGIYYNDFCMHEARLQNGLLPGLRNPAPVSRTLWGVRRI